MGIKKATIQFLDYLEIEKNRSKKTIENYGLYLDRFATWAGEHNITKVRDITQESIRTYGTWLNQLRGENRLKKNTQNYHLIALRSLLRYLAGRDIKTLEPQKITLSKTLKSQIAFLDAKESMRLLEAPLHISQAPIVRVRDRAILELLFSTGLRVSELASLQKDDIHLKNGECVIRGKGKPRFIILSAPAKECITTYLETRKDTLPPLFIRHDRAGKITKRTTGDDRHFFLTPRSIQRLIKRYAKIAGIAQDITPHTMRYSFASELLKRGTDIHSIQTLLGHANISTTHTYLHPSRSDKTFSSKGRQK